MDVLHPYIQELAAVKFEFSAVSVVFPVSGLSKYAPIFKANQAMKKIGDTHRESSFRQSNVLQSSTRKMTSKNTGKLATGTMRGISKSRK
jgi:hypothetical protein